MKRLRRATSVGTSPLAPAPEPVTGPAGARVRNPHGRLIVFAVLLVAYAIVTLCVILPSPLLDLDNAIKQMHLQRKWDGWYPRVEYYVLLGQRGPSTFVAAPWIAYLAWRERSPRPLVLLGTALLVLNLSVGVVKLITGRVGPFYSNDVHAVFAGGNIYPSGHVSNTVVLYGVLAMLATVHRRFAILAGVWVTVSVGLCTLYLNTHWFSDVLGGWLAGSLVLVSLPWMLPYTERFAEVVLAKLTRRRSAERDAVTRHPEDVPRPTAGVVRPPTAMPARTPALSGSRPTIRVHADKS